MALQKIPQQVLGNENTTPAMPPRRSTRQRNQIGQIVSSSRPIKVLDSPRPIIKYTSTTKPGTPQATQTSLPIENLPSRLPSQLQGLTKKGVQLLRHKQRQLQSPNSPVYRLSELCDSKSKAYPALKEAADATLVFAQEEAGTAICISAEGLILTCSHCIAETPEELDMNKSWWLLFSSGRVVQTKTIKWDPKRDLVLLQVVAAQEHIDTVNTSTLGPLEVSPERLNFPHITISSSRPKIRTQLLCIGHPGSEDLEVSRAGVKTGYDVLHISQGRFRGYAKGQDLQDNSEIGALMHDCWTYWGHSGAPLLELESGGLVGLHSSWDDKTGMRRGVGWEAVQEFTDEFRGEGGNRDTNLLN